MAIRITLLIWSAAELKLYLPVIDKALQTSHVSISLIVSRTKPHSKKKLEYNSKLNPFHKDVQIAYIDNDNEISKAVYFLKTDDLIVASAPSEQLYELKKNSKVRIFYLQHSSDIVSNWPYLYQIRLINLFDGFFVFSEYWKQEFIRELTVNKKINKFHSEELQAKIFIVGFPELDQVDSFDGDYIKEKYGLEANKKIIFIDSLPIVKHIPNAFYKYYFSINGTWVNKFKQILINLIYDFTRRNNAKWRLPYYIFKIISERKIPRYETIFSELREYCDRNNCLLICKSREKNNDPAWLKESCDLFKYDEEYYPFTLLELLYVSDAYVGFNSTSVLEGVYCNLHAELFHVYPMEFQYDNYGGNVFQYLEGCAIKTESWLSFKDVVKTNSWNKKIETIFFVLDVVVDNKDLHNYKDKFLGFNDGLAAKRVIEKLKNYERK